MAVDTPARIAILGAGPIGLEAALYARFLGYDVAIFDAGQVAENVNRWGHVRMFSPFRMNSTPLGLAALAAHDESYEPPHADALLTGHEWRSRYLFPLSQTDLLSDHLRLHNRVVCVARCDLLKHEHVGEEDRSDSPFRIVVCDREGQEWDSSADVVIDTTGVFHNPNWLGPGGAPAFQEMASRHRIRFGIPDLAGADRGQFVDKHVLVVGGGHSAATSIVALADLPTEDSAGRVVWVTRRALLPGIRGPLAEIPDDPLVERARLNQRANQIAHAGNRVIHWPATWVQAVTWDQPRGKLIVDFIGQHAGRHEFDDVIANVGSRPDNTLYAELQVHECYATGGPMKLAASRLRHASQDCLQQTSHGADSLLNPEPNFYILGAKSYGRSSNFLVSVGHQQIRDLFTVIGDRASLDLYQGAKL